MQHAYRDVQMLIPARFQLARRQAVAELVAELSATIAALPTVSTPSPADDPDQFNAWASRLIHNLPIRKNGDNHGAR